MAVRSYRRKEIADSIVSRAGKTHIFYRGSLVEFNSSFWFVQLNPSLIFPAFRKSLKKTIKINGRKRGKVFRSGGLAKFYESYSNCHGAFGKLRTAMYKLTGIRIPKNRMGYARLSIDRYVYEVVRTGQNEEKVVYQLFWPEKNIVVGTLVFSKNHDALSIREDIPGGKTALVIAAGFLVEQALFEMAGSGLMREIKI